MIAELVWSVVYEDKHFCSRACDERLTGKHPAREFVEPLPEAA